MTSAADPLVPPADLRRHATLDAYNPFVDSYGPVHASDHVRVDRVPDWHDGAWIPCFRKALVSQQDSLRRSRFQRELRVSQLTFNDGIAQFVSINFRRQEVISMDAGPSLNLWRRWRLQPLDTPQAPAVPLIHPRNLVDLLAALLRALQQGIHHHQGLHCDLHAGNICIPFERHPTVPGAIRPQIDQLRLIDLGNAVVPPRSADTGPLEIDPDAPDGRSARFSPALRAALRHDHRARRAEQVYALDLRIDLFALGWLGRSLMDGLGADDWAAEPAATADGWPQALAALCQDLLAQDSDGNALPAGLHQRYIDRLAALRDRLGPAPEPRWWLPQPAGAAASAAGQAAAGAATDTPLPPAWQDADDSATPLVPAPMADGTPPAGASETGAASAAPADALPAAAAAADMAALAARDAPPPPPPPQADPAPAPALPPLESATPAAAMAAAAARRSAWSVAPLAAVVLAALGLGGWWLGSRPAQPSGAAASAADGVRAPAASRPAARATPSPPAATSTARTTPTGVRAAASNAAPSAMSQAQPQLQHGTPPRVAAVAPAAGTTTPPAAATATTPPRVAAGHTGATAPTLPAPKAVTAPTAAPGRIDDRLNTLLTLAADGQWAKAEALLASLPATPAPLLRPDQRARLADGEAQVAALRYAAAEALFDDITRSVPQLSQGWKALGYAQLRRNQPARARAALTQALRLEPGDDGSWAFLAEALAAQGQTEAAAAALQLALYLAPDRRAALQLLRGDLRNLQHADFRQLVQMVSSRMDKLPTRPRKP